MRPFGETKKQNDESLCLKWTISYHCERSRFITWYRSHALNLVMSREFSTVITKKKKVVRFEGIVQSDSSVEQMVYFVRGLKRRNRSRAPEKEASREARWYTLFEGRMVENY